MYQKCSKVYYKLVKVQSEMCNQSENFGIIKFQEYLGIVWIQSRIMLGLTKGWTHLWKVFLGFKAKIRKYIFLIFWN